MKILILNYEYPPLGGGAGVCTRFEAEGLAFLGNEVTVLTTWFEGEKEISQEGNLKIIRLKSKRKFVYKSNPIEFLSWILFAKKYLRTYCKSSDYDICIANFALPGGEVAMSLKKNTGIPYIVVSHGQDIPWSYPKLMLKYHLLTYFRIKKIVNHSEKLVLLSQDKKRIADNFTGKKLSHKNVVIPNGCDMSLFKPDFSRKNKNFVILFVGRLVDIKDPFTFLNALKILKNSGFSSFSARILGDGDLRGKMEHFVQKNGLSENVVFRGWVSKGEMILEYQAASLQVMSSVEEAMSVAILESLACGQYVLSTPVSGNTDCIIEGENGEFFPFKKAEVLAQKIQQFYEQKFLNSFSVSTNILENFREKYDWKEIVKEYENLLKNILKK